MRCSFSRSGQVYEQNLLVEDRWSDVGRLILTHMFTEQWDCGWFGCHNQCTCQLYSKWCKLVIKLGFNHLSMLYSDIGMMYEHLLKLVHYIKRNLRKMCVFVTNCENLSKSTFWKKFVFTILYFMLWQLTILCASICSKILMVMICN